MNSICFDINTGASLVNNMKSTNVNPIDNINGQYATLC